MLSPTDQTEIPRTSSICQDTTDKDQIPEISVCNETPYQRKRISRNHEKSTFSNGSTHRSSTFSDRSKLTSPFSECSKETTPFSEASCVDSPPFTSPESQGTSIHQESLLEVPAFIRQHSLRRSFHRRMSEVTDVHSAFNKLDRALNGTLSPEKDLSADSKLDRTDFDGRSDPGSHTSYEIISSKMVSPDPAQEAKMTLNTSSFEVIVLPQQDTNLDNSAFEVNSYTLDLDNSPPGSTSSSKLESPLSPVASKIEMKDLDAAGDGYTSAVSPAVSTRSGSQTVPDYSCVVVDGRPLSEDNEDGVASPIKADRAVPDADKNVNDDAVVPTDLRSENERENEAPPPDASVPDKRSRVSSAMIEELMGQLASTRL